jgi:hypothetical protein
MPVGTCRGSHPSALVTGSAWALTGNAITAAWDGTTGNFLGTTNAQPLVIATTNTTAPQPIQIWVGNQETFRFNPPGSSAPAWSIQRGGGNQRGFHAVDLQSVRSAATQVASGDYSVIGGGAINTASGNAATVGGGWGNTASGPVATVGGGSYNTASGMNATVGGGYTNTASGVAATLAGAGSTPPAAILPPSAGAVTTPPAAILPPLAGARATPPAAMLPPSAGALTTPPAAILPPLAGAIPTPPAGYTAPFREDSISGSVTAALASVGRRRRHRRTSARTRTLLPLWMWTCGCTAGTAHRQASFASTRHRRTAAGQTTLRCGRRRRFLQTPPTPCRRAMGAQDRCSQPMAAGN